MNLYNKILNNINIYKPNNKRNKATNLTIPKIIRKSKLNKISHNKINNQNKNLNKSIIIIIILPLINKISLFLKHSNKKSAKAIFNKLLKNKIIIKNYKEFFKLKKKCLSP
jgi:hypothetical protein